MWLIHGRDSLRSKFNFPERILAQPYHRLAMKPAVFDRRL